jgi:signal peptidase II
LNRKKLWIALAIVPLSLVLDQFTKKLVQATMELHESIPVAGHWVRITFVMNQGMVFGLRPQEAFPSLPIVAILTVLMAIASTALLFYYIFTRDHRSIHLAGLSLILGGALGNLVDRIGAGKVVDFVDMGLSESLRWPVYNVADSCITIGIGFLVYLSFLKPSKEKPIQGDPSVSGEGETAHASAE